MLSLPVLLLLLSSLVGSVFPLAGSSMPPPTPIDLAGHQGERTAQYLSADTDLYLTINLDPYDDQAELFWTFVNAWRLDPNVQNKWAELLDDAESESGVNLEDDVLPWLGPEVALGVQNLVPGPDYADEPNAELHRAQTAIAACMAEAGTAQLDASVTGWSGNPGQVTCTVAGGDADQANFELYEAYSAIQQCLDWAGASELDAEVAAWNGSEGMVTATSSENYTFDAADFLYVAVPFGATYAVGLSGDITDGTPVSWEGISWDAVDDYWVNTGETTYDAANYLWSIQFQASYDVDIDGNIVDGHNVSWPNVIWDSVSLGWQSTVPAELPEEVFLIGTMDKTGSDAFFEKMKQWIVEDEFSEYQSDWYYSKYWVEFVEMSYRDCRLVEEVHHHEFEQYYEPYESGDYVMSTQFFGFTDEYVVTSSSQTAIERVIDLILDGGTSLADDANFQAAQAALPMERVGMFFVNLDQMKNQIALYVHPDLQALADVGLAFFPSYYAGSVHFTGDGIMLSVTYPLPEGDYVSTPEPDLLKTASLVPSNAWLFHSGQDIEASWAAIRAAVADNWASLTEVVFTGDGGLLPGMAEEDLATFDSLLAWINTNYGIDLEADMVGWMTGEWSMAVMPPEMGAEGQIVSMDTLAMFEVADPAGVQASLQNILDAVIQLAGQEELGRVQSAVDWMMQENGLTTVEGIQTATDNMSAFPDTTTPHGIAGVGWNLYRCDINGDGVFEPYDDRSYISDEQTIWSYTCDNDGTVHQLGGPDWALDASTVGDLQAWFIDAGMWQAMHQGSEPPPQPGWLFLDFDGRHYLVIGSNQSILEAAVNVSQGTIASLDEAAPYQGILSLLPASKMSLSYLDIATWVNGMLSDAQTDELSQVQQAVDSMMEDNSLTTIQGIQTPTDNMSAFPDTTTTHGTAGLGWTIYECDVNGDGQFTPYSGPEPYDRYYFWSQQTTWSYTCDNQGNVTQHANENTDLLMGLIPLEAALGFTYALGPNDTVVLIGTLYLESPPLTEQSIPTGDSTVQIAEEVFDLTHLDSSVGLCAVSLNVDITGAPEGASISTTALDKMPDDVMSAFGLAAADEMADILDVAYGMRVDLTNLSVANVGTAIITMKVGRAWADTYGVENIKVFRFSDGSRSVLPTTFVGYDGDYAVFEGTSQGLSTFALVAVAPKPEAFTVTDLGITPSEIKVGESATISITVVNSSIASGTYQVVLKIDGTEVESRNVAVDADSSKVVSFDVPRDAEGTYAIDVNGLTGQLKVVPEAAPAPVEEGGKTNWALIGGLVGGGVVILGGAAALLLVRRRRVPA